MKKQPQVNHLANIIDLKPYMKIAIDKEVKVDENGDYIVHVGYLRVSTDRQAEQGYGLDIQEKTVVEYCKYQEYENLLLFIDDGYTGTNMNRPAIQGIISFINSYNSKRSNIKINSVIIPRIDRLSRSLLSTLTFVQDYIVAQNDSKNSEKNHNKEDINFISVNENYCRIDKDNPQGKFLLMLFGTLAEYDRDLIVQKMQKGRRERVASGKWLGGGKTPFGYRYNKSTGELEIVPEEAKIVREIFRLYIDEKMPPQKIAERFGFSGDSSIRQILKRKSSTGCITLKGEEFHGNHVPIIPLEVWEAAQNELQRRSSHRTDSSYLLSGLIYCGECGAKMRYQSWGQYGVKIYCYSQQKSKPSLVKDENCNNEKYWSEDVENAVIEELFKFNYLGNKENQKISSNFDVKALLTKELNSAKKQLSRLYDFDTDDEDDVIKDKIKECRTKVKNLTTQINNEEQRLSIQRNVQKAKNILCNLEDTWPHMTEKEKQTICQELIDRITIFKNGTIDVHLKLQNYLIKHENEE